MFQNCIVEGATVLRHITPRESMRLQEKCQEQYEDLFVTFIDLTMTFDTVCTAGL